MNKETARKLYKAKRKDLKESSEEGVMIYSHSVVKKFIASRLWENCKVIHVFIPIENRGEVDTIDLIDFFFTNHPEIKICTSIIAENKIDLLHTYITFKTIYNTNYWRIPEPAECNYLNETEIDLVLIPLLAFDKKGNRVGYGKGFYDRFLQKCRPDVVKVGLSLFEPTEELIEADTWDVPLDWSVTPKQLYEF